MKTLFFKKSRKAITALILALTICVSMATPAFAATQEIKIGTNNYQYNTHYDNGLKPCFATDGYCMISVWSGINTPPSHWLTPSDIPETIDGYPVVCMRTAYQSYGTEVSDASIDKAPEIPRYMQDMEMAFINSKIPAPPSTIPDMVVNLKSAFANCSKINSFPSLGNNIENMEYSFSGCKSLRVRLPCQAA